MHIYLIVTDFGILLRIHDAAAVQYICDWDVFIMHVQSQPV